MSTKKQNYVKADCRLHSFLKQNATNMT